MLSLRGWQNSASPQPPHTEDFFHHWDGTQGPACQEHGPVPSITKYLKMPPLVTGRKQPTTESIHTKCSTESIHTKYLFGLDLLVGN